MRICKLQNTPLGGRYSGELSHTRRSLDASFRSEKNSISSIGADELESTRPRKFSLKRLYSMVGPEWIYGILSTICSFITGTQMPLFALGISQALVAYYMDWDSTCHEIKRIAILLSCGAVISLIVCTAEHLFYGMLGERLTLRMREIMFSAILRNEIGWFDDLNNTSSVITSCHYPK